LSYAIHKVKGKKSELDIAYYVVGNYVSNQPIKRLSYSQKWVCRGFCKIWKRFLDTYHGRAVEVWDKWLLAFDLICYQEIRMSAFS
jgi:hypothetical protein